MKMPKISVIVPVFNSGDYLERLFLCFEKQTFKDFEIVFVEDGSTDNSLELLKRFSKKTSISVSIVQNSTKKGVGYVRSLGLKNSNQNSPYIMFVDSDDTFSDAFFEKMIQKEEETNADLICCGFNIINEPVNTSISEKPLSMTGIVFNAWEPEYPYFLTSVALWNKLFKRECIKNGTFGDINHGEDLFFLLSVFPKVKNVMFIDDILYDYRINKASLISSLSYDRFHKTCARIGEYSSFIFNTPFFDVASAFVFIRIGISTTIKVCQNEKRMRKSIVKESKKLLSESFNVFGKNKYLSLKYLLKAKKTGLKIWILKVLYRLNLFGIVVLLLSSKGKNKVIRW